MCNHLVPSSCLCLCTPPQLGLRCYISLPPLDLCCVHKSKSFPFISSTIESISFILLIIAHHFHGYNIWSYSCYFFIQPYFHETLIITILLKYIDSWANIELMFRSVISRTKHCVRSGIQMNEVGSNNSWSIYHNRQSSKFSIYKSVIINWWRISIHQTLLPLMGTLGNIGSIVNKN